MPLEQRQVSGTNSFLKTCLSAKIVIAWFWIIQIIVLATGFMAGFLGVPKDAITRTMDLNLLTTFFFYCVFFILAWFAARKYPHLGFKEIFDLRFKKLNKFKVFFVPLLVSLLMALGTVCIMEIRKVSPPTPLGTSLAQSSSWTQLAFMVFGAFLAPLFEELLYRGAFFRVLLKNKGKVWAIVGTSLCFWAVHADRAGDHLVLGLLLVFSFCVTWIRFLTRTTLTAIIMHYTYNLSVFAFGILFLLVTNASLLQSSFLDFYPKHRHEAILLEALEKNPDFAEAYNNLAWFYALEGQNLEKALSLVERAIELEPESAHIYDTKAEILSRLGRENEAIAIEEVLIERFPDVSFFKEQRQTFQQRKLQRSSS